MLCRAGRSLQRYQGKTRPRDRGPPIGVSTELGESVGECESKNKLAR